MSDPILLVHNLVGGYGKMTILNGTTFAVPQATITTIIGPNGAGKSTVFKAIFGLLKLREGNISFANRDVTSLSQRELLTAGICYVPQGRNIFPELSVRHNIELGAVVAGRDITDLPARIEAALDRFPVLRRKATQQASTLSGGEQKQLEIAPGSLSGSLDGKLRAVATAGFDAVEIFENDLLSFNGSPRDVGKLCRDLGLAICAFQPFRDFEGMPEPQRARNFARAERKFDLMAELQTDLLLICSNISPASLGGI